MNETDTFNDRPQTPDENNCCGNGCNPCIFDIHKQLLDKWNKKESIQRNESKNLLDPLSYKLFFIQEIRNINSDYVIIYLKYKDRCDSDGNIFLNAGEHVVVNISSWSKPFTPISWTNDTLTLLVRVYFNGVNTNKLKNIELNTEVRVRGPYGDFQYFRNIYKEIIMFGIGSGVAAFYPIAKAIVNDELDDTRIYLNLGFQSVDKIPLKRELKLLADFWNVDCTVYITQKDNVQSLNGVYIIYEKINERIFKSVVEKYLSETTLILICGNDNFNKSLETWSKKYCYTNYYVFK
ncbi:hypothetical protein PV327_004867 [Microctonus hyperodae]|uniref:FAD-binding FR-type domain-containing protein n=1 Tax=Microctonus hyperodae TaxID=165561 RepID=A0AA39KN53_MICHY|nr:hypothetical protein PV327_004867 [Microctonus hyperodae]